MQKTGKKNEDSIPMLMDLSATFRVSGVANRLNRSASAFYRNNFGIGVQEWRLLLVLGRADSLTVGDAAIAADIDTAAASRALKTLKDQELVTLEMIAASRGRMTIVRLTEAGQNLYEKLRAASEARAAQITQGLSAAEIEQLNDTLGRIISNIENMSADTK